jgi:translation initiation factor 1
MPSNKPSSGGLVYSTDAGRMCPACRQAIADCRCAALAAQQKPAGDGVVRVSRETAGRGGKAVTLVRGVPLQGEALAALGKRLRTFCGAGGTLKDGVLEVQGDHRDRVVDWLAKEGFTVKRAGG